MRQTPRYSDDSLASGTESEAVGIQHDVSRDARRGQTRSVSRGWLVRRLLMLADISGLVSAFILTRLLFDTGGDRLNSAGRWSEDLFFFASIPLWVVTAKLFRLYEGDEERADHSTVDDFVAVFLFVTVASFLLTHTLLFTSSTAAAFVFWGTAILFVSAGRVMARTLARRSISYLQNTVVVGAGEVGQLVARKILQHPEYGLNLLGFVDDNPKENRGDLDFATTIGSTRDLPRLVGALGIERVIFAFSNDPESDLVELIHELRRNDIQLDIVPRFFDAVGPNATIRTLEGVPLVGLPPMRIAPSWRLLKRAVDIVFALIMLVILAPLLAVIALGIKRDSRGPILFRQTRLGENMTEFTYLKFRTMKIDTDQRTHRDAIYKLMDPSSQISGSGLYKLAHDDTITRVGRWLRRVGLDELPVLINVLRGEMSLVGPRPCLPYEVEHFAPHHFERFLMPPGMTGLQQVVARGRATFGEALDMDVAYVRGWSLGLDIRLLLRTPMQMSRLKSL
jgi:exopolysaccharide biosynthesis polyprenyl glycosylphosphotransferase